MAEAAVSFAVETLGNLLIQKAVFLKGVKGEVKWVKNELKRMQCFLKDAAKKQSESERVHNWISEIREAAHDAEDAIQMFVLHVESRGQLWRCVCFPDHVYRLYKVGEEIESIRKRLEDIEDGRLKYNIKDLDDHQIVKSQLQVESRRRLDYWRKDNHVVGLVKDVELLLGKAIFEKGQGLSVAAVLGMGGIGKSTLATKIYNHPAVAERFECRAWVVVSSEFTPEDIMKQILLQMGISLEHLKLLESVDDNLGRRENLKKELHERLARKRYFIVLDDVWEATHWESLSSAFPDEDKASRLLLTSRNQVMTMYSGFVHNMKVLDDNQSWELFLRKAFVDSTNGKFPKELHNIGEEILKKCGGLPLAISIVGGILAKKPRCESEWEKVLKEMKSHLNRSKDINTISAILELSYQNIPPELKACFLCLGFFKEDAVIKAKDLIHIWVAQGLVQNEVVGIEETMEDAARGYLNELISRNMVQVKESRYDRVKTCRIHDLLRDLSIRKAKEEIDFEEVREEGNSQHQSLSKPRHRAIYSNRPRFVYSTNRNQYIRSLFFHGETRYSDGGPSSYWKSFELLRILDMGTAELRVLPKAIGVLTGLRYFKMRYVGGVTSKLPRSWMNLKNLEVLDLRGNSVDIVIDIVLLKMESLRHLYLDISYSEVSLGNLRSLRSLSLFRVKDSDLWQLQGMLGITSLALNMSEMSDVKTLFTNLFDFENLVYLTLKECTKPVNMAGLGALQHVTRLKLHNFRNVKRLPADFPQSVSYLTLSLLWLTEDPMRVLERLPKLLYLKMVGAYSGEEMAASRRGFPKLKVLHLRYMNVVRIIEVGEGAMPELEQLVIRNCLNLKIENLPEKLKSALTDAD